MSTCLPHFNHLKHRGYKLLVDERGGWPEIFLGFGLITIFGSILGILLNINNNNNNDLAAAHPIYKYVSGAIGYTYTVAWSVSFYPQVIHNYYNRSTTGLSVDFILLNLFGFCCYGAFTVAFYWSGAVQDAYKERHAGNENMVQLNDVVFVLHAIVLCSITLGQIVYYNGIRWSPRHHDDGSSSLLQQGSELQSQSQAPSIYVRKFLVSMMVVCIVYAFLIISSGGSVGTSGCEGRLCSRLNWLDFLYFLALLKILITITKYIPQVILNYTRKSTKGWSIWAILLDFMGGFLSTLQLVLDCHELNDWEGITGDLAKFGLGFISIFFDVSILYKNDCAKFMNIH